MIVTQGRYTIRRMRRDFYVSQITLRDGIAQYMGEDTKEVSLIILEEGEKITESALKKAIKEARMGIEVAHLKERVYDYPKVLKKQCRNCRNKVGKDFNYCPICGASLDGIIPK